MLNINQIQYFPIGGENALRVMHLDEFEDAEHKINVIGRVTGVESFDKRVSVYSQKSENGVARCIISSINNIKPLLRSLEDLYKERNGKVDIVELAKISVGIPNLKVWYDDEVGKVYFELRGEQHEFGLLAKSNDFFSSSPHISNSLQCIQHLFENHYDVFGLIDKGLAIDTNTIEI